MPMKMLDYSMIEIFTNERARCKGKPMSDTIIEYVRGLNNAARCSVTRAIGGAYENGEVATQNILVLSFNMPLKIEILLPSVELDEVLAAVEKMVCDGIVTVRAVRAGSLKG